MRRIIKISPGGLALALVLLALAGCSTESAEEQLTAGILPPVMNPITEVNQSLRNLPPPANKVVVAVYNYSDQTGQFKPSETTQTLSKAVTQGATSILIKALQDVGEGSWFTVVERERIDNLLKERKIITQMRMTYLGETKINAKALPPLLFAGIIFEGGIIGFDSNIQTGGVGARLLGIGGDLKYRLDTITIYLRAVSTKTGQVVGSVTTHKTIASVGLQGGVFKYIAIDKILEAEAGFTKNEPEQFAVQQAIEKAVYAMLIEGADTDVWSFADAATQARLVQEYRAQQYDSSRSASGNDRLAETAKIAAPQAEATGSVRAAKESGGAPPAAIAAKPAAAPGASPPVPARTVTLPSRNPSASALKPASVGPSEGSAGSIRSSLPSNRGWAAASVSAKERFGHAVSGH